MTHLTVSDKNTTVRALSILLAIPFALSTVLPLTGLLPEAMAASKTVPHHSSVKVLPVTKAASAAKSASTASASIPAADFASVSPLDLLKEPDKYLNKHVAFDAVFNRFSDTGLDYKKVFRDSRDYVSLFVYRPDVTARKIPMSELKLFFPRKKSDDVQTLETGDTIHINGTVFNTALGEPWMDINDLKIIQKVKDTTKKRGEECC